MRFMKEVVIFFTSIGLVSCTHTFEVTIPKDRFDKFASCMKNPSSTWATRASGNELFNSTPISTANLLSKVSTSDVANLQYLVLAPDAETRSMLEFVEKLSERYERSQPGAASTFVNVFSVIRHSGKSENENFSPALKPAAENFIFGTLNISSSDKDKFVALAEQQANEVDELLSSPMHSNLISIQEKLSTGDRDGQDQDIRISNKNLRSYFDSLNQLSREGAWESYQASTKFSFYNQVALAAANKTKILSQMEAKRLVDSYRAWKTAIFVNAYLKAYFRNGKFASLKVDFASLQDAFPKADWGNLNEKMRAELKKILDKLTSKATFGRISEDGFVTRGGVTLQFPAAEISLNAAKRKIEVSDFDYVSVGGDMARVAIEAIFDSRIRLPAVSEATGVKLGGRPDAEVLGLPDFAKIKTEVTADGFAEVEELSNKVDGTTSTFAGQLFRGGGPLALNNEALAHVLEVTVGTTSRKTSELVVWCREATKKKTGTGTLGDSLASDLAKVRVTIDRM